MTDWLAWHDGYEDPGSGLPWRLDKVRDYLRTEFDARAGDLRVLSVCAGDGRDVLVVLDGRPDSDRFHVTLVELNPDLAARASDHGTNFADVQVLAVDAGRTDAYVDVVPVDVLLLVGVFGNVTDDDIARTVDAVPALCAPGALVVWSRGLERDDLDNDGIRRQLREVGCTERDYAEHPSDGGRTSVGAVRFAGRPRPLPAGERLFGFTR